MLALTKKTDYALIALCCLHQNANGGRDNPVSARSIAEQFGLPLPLLMNVLKDLAAARLVHSTRGAQGGYSLALEASQITVLDVVTAIEGPLRFASCAQGLPIVGQGCQIGETCPIREPVRELHDRMVQLFAGMTLADLFDPKQRQSEVAKQSAVASAVSGSRISA